MRVFGELDYFEDFYVIATFKGVEPEDTWEFGLRNGEFVICYTGDGGSVIQWIGTLKFPYHTGSYPTACITE